MNKLNMMDWVAFVLLIVGGLNWGLSVFDMNIVAILGDSIANIVYIVVALAAVYVALMLTKYSRR